MVFVNVAYIFRAAWIHNMHGKNTFRAAEVGEGFLLAVFGNVLTGACPKLIDSVTAFGILLGNALAVVALPVFLEQTQATHHMKSKVMWC